MNTGDKFLNLLKFILSPYYLDSIDFHGYPSYPTLCFLVHLLSVGTNIFYLLSSPLFN
nr:MAG TPA: hypothetical protein [Bacteriophage sp.]